MDPEYAAAYRNLYERHWWWRARERFLLDRFEARAAAENRRGRRILDVGCGDGLFFDRLSDFGEVQGIEPDADILSAGPWRDAIHAGTLETFVADGAFHWILMLDVLEHMGQPGPALVRAREVAADDANLFVTVPAFQSLWTRHDELNRHYVRYDRASLGKLLAEAGWKPQEMKYFFHWLAPLKMLVKLKESVRSAEPAIETVPSRLVNELAFRFSVLEGKLLSGLSIPIGTSLYARSVRA